MMGADHSEGDQPDEAWFTYRMDPDERPTEAVLMAVSAVRNVSVLELDRLTDTIDPDALDSIFSGPREGSRDTRLRFTYADCVVEVTNPVIRVKELE